MYKCDKLIGPTHFNLFHTIGKKIIKSVLYYLEKKKKLNNFDINKIKYIHKFAYLK